VSRHRRPPRPGAPAHPSPPDAEPPTPEAPPSPRAGCRRRRQPTPPDGASGPGPSADPTITAATATATIALDSDAVPAPPSTSPDTEPDRPGADSDHAAATAPLPTQTATHDNPDNPDDDPPAQPAGQPTTPRHNGRHRRRRPPKHKIGILSAAGLPVLGIPALLILLLSGADAPLDTDHPNATAMPPPTTRPWPSTAPLPAELVTDDAGTPVSADTLAAAAANPAPTDVVRLTATERQVPTRVLAAYQQSATTLTAEQPGCHLRWELLAGIGKVETNHATGRAITPDGTITPTILGPRLDGHAGVALIPDTDHGHLDHDTTYDRAVGPMQFLPATWTGAGRDGNHDSTKNPDNIDDATLATAGYLCAHGRNLATPTDLYNAIRAYNPSDTYVRAVLAWTTGYTTTPATPTNTLPTVAIPAPIPLTPTAPAPLPTPFPIVTLTPRPTTPATTPPATTAPNPPTSPAAACPTTTLVTSTLTASLTTTALELTGRYTTTATAPPVLHTEARTTTGHTLASADITVPTTPPAESTLLARLPLDHLVDPGQTATITLVLTTTPASCPAQILVTLSITNITRSSPTPAPTTGPTTPPPTTPSPTPTAPAPSSPATTAKAAP